MSEEFLGLTAEVLETARGPIEVARVGSGPAVVVVHGSPGSWRQAVALAQQLSDGFEVLLPSRPGYGRTPLSSGRTIDDQGRLYLALLDAVGIEGAHVVGISGGGPSSLAAARLAPDRVLGLVLCCAVNAEMMEVPLAMRVVAGVPGVGEAVAALSRRLRSRRPDEAELDRASARSLTADERRRAQADPRIRQELIDFLHSHAVAPPGIGGLRNDVRQFGAARRGVPDRRPVTVPLLVQHGDADTVVPPAHAARHALLSDRAEVQIYEEAGHVFLFTRRSEVVPRIRAFLKGR